jgi:hypothetical protein
MALGRVIWLCGHEPLRQRGNRRDQFGRIDRLGQMDLKSCSQGLHAILRSRVRRQRCGWDLPDAEIVMSFDAIDELESVELRHAQISDNDIR